MKRNIIFIICAIISVCSFAQEHIKFNGATFGQDLQTFVAGFPNKPATEQRTYKRGYNRDLCNLYHCDVLLNAETWRCDIYSSRKSNSVFTTVCVNRYDDLQNGLMFLVKSLENKYGGHREEKAEDLGEIEVYYKYGTTSYYKEMLALYYYVRNSNNKIIGEIRISAAPTGKLYGKDQGYIELSYTDYSAREKATQEYDSLMQEAL